MKRMKDPHWIRHTHVFEPDEYECSACGQMSPAPAEKCPACGETMLGLEDPQDWVDEMAEMDIILGDDRLG